MRWLAGCSAHKKSIKRWVFGLDDLSLQASPADSNPNRIWWQWMPWSDPLRSWRSGILGMLRTTVSVKVRQQNAYVSFLVETTKKNRGWGLTEWEDIVHTYQFYIKRTPRFRSATVKVGIRHKKSSNRSSILRGWSMYILRDSYTGLQCPLLLKNHEWCYTTLKKNR